jgi:hypothetical protein
VFAGSLSINGGRVREVKAIQPGEAVRVLIKAVRVLVWPLKVPIEALRLLGRP